MTPEQSAFALCAAYDLLSLDMTFHHNETDHLCVTVQWRDESSEPNRRGCVIGSGPTLADAFADAIAGMARKRMPAFDELVAEIAR